MIRTVSLQIEDIFLSIVAKLVELILIYIEKNNTTQHYFVRI